MIDLLVSKRSDTPFFPGFFVLFSLFEDRLRDVDMLFTRKDEMIITTTGRGRQRTLADGTLYIMNTGFEV